MPRLSVPLTEEQHRAIKIKAAQVDLSQAEIARRLLFAWLCGDVQLSDQPGEWDYRAGGFSVEHWNKQ